MQRNLRHIWGDMMHYRPLPKFPSDIWGDVSPRGIYATDFNITSKLNSFGSFQFQYWCGECTEFQPALAAVFRGEIYLGFA